MWARLLGVRIFDLEACGACNLSCPFCPRDQLPKTGNMSQETFSCFLERVPLGASDTLSFVGIGEPTLNRRLPDFIRQARTRYPRAHTWVTSNGTFLNQSVVPRLIEAGLETLDVSFNGLERESYERLMKGARFEEVLANLEYTRQEIIRSGSSMRLQINFIVSRENAGQEEAVLGFWRARGIDHFRVQRLHDRAGLTRVAGLTPIDGPGLRTPSCSLFETITFITWKGEVLYCCHDIPRRHKIADIHHDSWEEIQRRKLAISAQRAWPALCRACNDPLRHDIRGKIDEMIGKQVREQVAGAWRASVKAVCGVAGI